MRWIVRRGYIVLGMMLGIYAGGCVSIAPGGCTGHPRLGRDFLIIAHHGVPNQACENTLESFTQAIRLGANALELDVSVTRDGELVLWHDWLVSLENTLRPTGACSLVYPPQRRPLHEVGLVEFLRDYGYEQAGHRVPVTTFAEFVNHFRRNRRVRYFFLDLKIPADLAQGVAPMFARAVAILRQHRVLAKAVFTTPYEEVFAALSEEAQRWYRTTGERVDIAFDTEGPQIPLSGAWPSAVQRNQAAGTRFALWGKPVVPLESPHAFLVAEMQRLNALNASRPSQERMRFILWTLNDQDDLCGAVELGVDGIITDEPGRLR